MRRMNTAAALAREHATPNDAVPELEAVQSGSAPPPVDAQQLRMQMENLRREMQVTIAERLEASPPSYV